jgi:hypothetical protein
MAVGDKNAGDWAELYVLLNILSNGKLYAADGQLNKLDDNYFPVVSIEMEKTGQPNDKPIPINYLIDSKAQSVVISSEGVSTTVDMSTFESEAQSFFEIISTRVGRAYAVPEIDGTLGLLNNPITKQSSSKKADIHIVIHDIMTGFENEVGFSIKSKHSSAATLINASGQTLFQYSIGLNGGAKQDAKSHLSIFETKEGKQVKVGPKVRFQRLLKAGFDVSFVKIKSLAFQENIQIIDSSLDVFLAECLFVFMERKVTGLSEIVEIVAERNPCKYKTTCNKRLKDFYQYKMKRLIVDAALGMQPKAPWDGKYDASGGYIVVKGTGDVVCYHLYNWNALQDYLYNNLRFETPTSTGTGNKKAFNYALYYEENSLPYVDICLQIRFK